VNPKGVRPRDLVARRIAGSIGGATRTCFVITIFLLAALLSSIATAQAKTSRHDLVIYGGTSGGIAAAIQAARMGKTAVLIEPTQHLGGLTTGGLGATDIGNKQAIGGVAREFYGRVWKHYNDPANWTRETREQY
jgi:NADPH-dependent 2,4-dienoyl-CoA reductase/sulfur reductase-like enzyme